MVDICGLTPIEARCIVRIGGVTATTPMVIAANVSRNRGQLSAAASATFYYEGNENFNAGSNFAIYIMGQIVFNGVAKRIIIGPSLRCAGELRVTIQGEDRLNRIENRAITRRQKLAGLGPLAFISGVYKRTELGFDDPPSRYDISSSSSPVEVFSPTTNHAAMHQFLKGNDSITGDLHPVTRVADKITNISAPSSGGGSFILHDHSTLDLSGPHAGGPARGVFGVK